MPTKPPTESAQTRRKNDDGEGLPQRDGNDDNNHNNDDGKSSVTVTALEKITDLARELEATLARAALRDGQRGALVAQHLKLVDVAAQALTESGKAIAALEGELMQAAQAARQQQEKYQAEQQQLRGEQRSLQDKCNAILASVATLQEQFAAEREGRSVAERNLSKAREEHAIEIASARSKLETVVRETEHKERLTAAQVIEEGQTLLRAKQKQLVQQHRRYTSALVTKLEAEAAAKVKQASLAAAAAAKEQGIALQQTKDENRMYKAELLRLKRLHGDVSSRVQHLQMQLFNCQQEAGRLAQSERDRVVQEHKGSEALLRREIASLESRLSDSQFRFERETAALEAKLKLSEQAHTTQCARLEALVASVRHRAEEEAAETDAKHNEVLMLLQARIRKVVASKDATIASLRSALTRQSQKQQH